MLVRTYCALLARMTLAGVMLAACGAKRIPPELLDARVAYERAQAGPTKTVNPAGLFEAGKALDTAERRQQKSPGSLDARDAAYVALRKVQLAEANTRSALAEARAREESARSEVDERARRTIGEPEKTSSAQAEGRSPRAAPPRARSTGDRAGDEVMRTLDGRTTMHVDDRGLVLTLATDDVFVGRTSMLAPPAVGEIEAIADALRRHAESAAVEIYGFSDDIGSGERNLELSTSRARAVRDLLVSRGVRADRVSAEGRGARDPVDSNASPEGRAHNRRIEIVARVRGIP